MGKHTTEVSLNLFNFLISLGTALNYFTDTEYPMSENPFGGQAIDIAWFNEPGNKFPLFIFEIESTSNNSIANNPTKIFGKDSKVFEKPLFFFHVIIGGAEYSEKYNDLMGLFGKYNYELFRINNGEIESLLLKILSQHRRIRDEIDLFEIIKLINNNDAIKSQLELDNFLINVEKIIHENQLYQIGQVYADIASRNKLFQEHYFKFIYRSYNSKSLPFLRYDSYCARITSEFINLGILYSKIGIKFQNVDFLSLLIEAQKTDTFNKIEYLPGLNYDYDNFIHDFVPFYLALIFFLFEGNINVQRYIKDLAIDIINRLDWSDDFVFGHHVSWGLLMTASNQEFYEDFEELKNLVNNKNGILNCILFCPIFMNDHHKLPDSNLILVPDRNEYIEVFKGEFNHLSNDMDIHEISIMSLSEDWKDEIDCHFNLGVSLANLIIKSLY